MSAAYIQMQLGLDFFMEANNVNLDQTAPKEAIWPGLILFEI